MRNRLSLPALIGLAALFLLAGCGDDDPVSPDPGDDPEPEPEIDTRQVSYDLNAVSNDGDIPDGVEATAIFRELGDDETLVTLELEDGSTDTGLIHTAHIHENDVETGGDIAVFLGAIDGLEGAPGVSHEVVDRSFDELVDFDGFINIHQSNAELDNVIAQGNIGANADAEVVESDIEPVANPQTETVNLDAIANPGALPDGASGTATFRELTATQTLVTLELDGGSPETGGAHPAHIHDENGEIAFFLGPIDGLEPAPGASDFVVGESFNALTGFDGYINIHESNAALENVITEGTLGDFLRQASYELEATSNDGDIPGGVEATAVFQELGEDETLVTLELDGGATETELVHTAHIHENDVETGGDIAVFLGAIDGLEGAPGVSHEVVDRSFSELRSFDGFINIHESNAALGEILAQGNIGANAPATVVKSDIDPVANPASVSYELEAVANDGVVSEGAAATATFKELTDTQTLVTLELEDGPTGTELSHPAHIHENDVETGGGIEFFLGPIDGLDVAPGASDFVVGESFDTLEAFDGYINIHQSNAALNEILSQGNIGANANGESGGNGNSGY